MLRSETVPFADAALDKRDMQASGRRWNTCTRASSSELYSRKSRPEAKEAFVCERGRGGGVEGNRGSDERRRSMLGFEMRSDEPGIA